MRARVKSIVLAVTAALLPGAAPEARAAPCATAEAEYVLAANLKLSDTPMGMGDGTHTIGPGKAVLRFGERGAVEMLSYTMRDVFTVRVTTVFWTTEVTTSATSRATPDACGVVADGTLVGNRIRWRTPMREYRTDGTLSCRGSFCGSFGAPPRGESPLHVGPEPQPLSDWVFSSDMTTFTMARTQGARTEMPKQSSAVAVSGRLTKRVCVAPRPCLR
jgi:hypothetical protein